MTVAPEMKSVTINPFWDIWSANRPTPNKNSGANINSALKADNPFELSEDLLAIFEQGNSNSLEDTNTVPTVIEPPRPRQRFAFPRRISFPEAMATTNRIVFPDTVKLVDARRRRRRQAPYFPWQNGNIFENFGQQHRDNRDNEGHRGRGHGGNPHGEHRGNRGHGNRGHGGNPHQEHPGRGPPSFAGQGRPPFAGQSPFDQLNQQFASQQQQLNQQFANQQQQFANQQNTLSNLWQAFQNASANFLGNNGAGLPNNNGGQLFPNTGWQGNSNPWLNGGTFFPNGGNSGSNGGQTLPNGNGNPPVNPPITDTAVTPVTPTAPTPSEPTAIERYFVLYI